MESKENTWHYFNSVLTFDMKLLEKFYLKSGRGEGLIKRFLNL